MTREEREDMRKRHLGHLWALPTAQREYTSAQLLLDWIAEDIQELVTREMECVA